MEIHTHEEWLATGLSLDSFPYCWGPFEEYHGWNEIPF